MRSCKKLNEATHTAAGSVKIRKYIYRDKLIERGTEDSLSSVIEERERDEPETASASSSEKRSDQASYKRKKHDEVEHMMIKAMQAGNNPGSNMSFFAGTVPYLKNFDADDLLDIQMAVLQLISKIECNKKRRTQVMSHGLHDTSNKNLNYGCNLLLVCIIFCLELNVFFYMLFHF
jgi:hypothetical protein